MNAWRSHHARWRRRRLAVTHALAVLGLAVSPLTVAADGGPVLAIGISERAAQDEAARAAFVATLAREFGASGFARVDSAWCAEPPCAASAAHALALDIRLGEVRHAELERGIGFSLGGPRDAGRIEGEVMPVDCRLRTPGGRLVATRRVEQAVDPARLGEGAYLADRVGDACAPLLEEQQVVVLAPSPRRNVITTADPDVFIEKREVDSHAPAGTLGVLPGVPAARTAAVSTAAATVAGEAGGADPAGTTPATVPANGPHLTRQRDGARTQYVLHNKGDTVILEWGNRR